MRETQVSRLVKYIQDFGAITSYEAYTELGITQLSSRITDAERLGFRFSRETVKDTNRYGEPVYFKKYKLEEV